MTPIVTYRDGDRFSAIVGNEVAYQLPRPVVVAFILAKVEGATKEQAEAWIDSPVSPEVFRASQLAALSSGVEEASAEIAQIVDRDRARELEVKVDLLHGMLESIDSRLARENQLAEQANRIEAEKLAAIKRAEVQAEAERKAQAEAAERQRQAAQAEALRKQDRKATRNYDGSVDVTEAIPGQRGTRKVVARYPTVEAARAAGVPV